MILLGIDVMDSVESSDGGKFTLMESRYHDKPFAVYATKGNRAVLCGRVATKKEGVSAMAQLVKEKTIDSIFELDDAEKAIMKMKRGKRKKNECLRSTTRRKRDR